MTDPFKNFDRDFARSQRTFKVAFGLTVTVIVLIALATIVGLGMIAHQLMTTNPEDVAKGAGHLVGVFMNAAKGAAKP